MVTNLKNSSYIDSSAFIAYLDHSDSTHSFFVPLFNKALSLYTTPLVITETHSWFLKRYDTYKGIIFLNFIEEFTPLSICNIEEGDFQGAKKIIKKYRDRKLTLVDAYGIYLIQKNKIKECWSTDRHFLLSKASVIGLRF